MFLLLTFNGGMCDENLILFMKPPDEAAIQKSSLI